MIDLLYILRTGGIF